MNAIKTFNFQSQSVRIEFKNGEPLFCLTDVAQILEIQNTKSSRFNMKEDGVHKMYLTDKLGRNQEATFISEPNLYRVIFRSNKTEAVKFQDWIFEEVIPQIRKTGGYQIQPKTTVADRTPLRQAVSALVGKCNIDYSSAYNMVHQRFGVESIEEIAADKLPDAVAYIHALTLHSGLFGEVLDRLPETGAYVALSERELSNFATATYYLDWATRQLYDLSEPLKQLGARDKGVAAWTLRHESHSWLKHCRETLQRVQPEMRDAYFREHVAGSLRRMDALMRG